MSRDMAIDTCSMSTLIFVILTSYTHTRYIYNNMCVCRATIFAIRNPTEPSIRDELYFR